MINPTQLDGKLALVTGASRGIGKSIALALAELGAAVVGTATSPAGAESITAYLNDAGFKGKGTVLDVCDATGSTSLVKSLEQEYGQIDILVNNAGITRDNLLLRMKDEEWFATLDTNLTGVFRLSRLVLRGMMKARWGRIIQVSSISAYMGNPGQTNYAAAKAGLSGFSKALAIEVASRGITVNSVAPGFISTEMTAAISDTHKADLAARIPLGREGKPEEIAAAVAFLALPIAGYITGETLHVNGGLYMD